MTMTPAIYGQDSPRRVSFLDESAREPPLLVPRRPGSAVHSYRASSAGAQFQLSAQLTPAAAIAAFSLKFARSYQLFYPQCVKMERLTKGKLCAKYT